LCCGIPVRIGITVSSLPAADAATRFETKMTLRLHPNLRENHPAIILT
jgi:hypothetical protein